MLKERALEVVFTLEHLPADQRIAVAVSDGALVHADGEAARRDYAA
jgi:hypothetical protein